MWSKERGVGIFGASALCQSQGCQMSKYPTGCCYHVWYLDRKSSVINWIYLQQDFILYSTEWKGINRKQSTRWQHLSRLKASAFLSLQKNCCYETQQLIVGTGTANWWVTEPHWPFAFRYLNIECPVIWATVLPGPIPEQMSGSTRSSPSLFNAFKFNFWKIYYIMRQML